MRRRLGVRARLTAWYTGVLLAVLLVISGLSYALLRRALVQEMDASLLTMTEVIRGAAERSAVTSPGAPSEVMLQTILGPELSDELFQLSDWSGRPGVRSSRLRGSALPLSERAHAAAARGERTVETITVGGGARARLLTAPVMHEGRPAQLIQVALSMRRTEHTLGRYVDTLVLLVPVGLLLSAVGGAALARVALKPVDAMSRTARRISAEDLSRRVAPTGAGDELDHLAETLNGMLERLDRAFQQVKRFSADAAHELRTPLTTLKGGMEVALRTPRTPAEYRAVLVSSLEEVDRLVQLAEALLELSRRDSGAPAPSARVALEPLLLDVAEVGAQLGRAAGVAVALKETAPLTVMGEADALRRAVLNLVENAVKYTPAGGRVDVALAAAGPHAVVSVHDTGIGLDRAEAEAIFQPFVRLDPARDRDPRGAGLGLAITASIVAAHGGRVTVESAPGMGSTFALRLPLAPASRRDGTEGSGAA